MCGPRKRLIVIEIEIEIERKGREEGSGWSRLRVLFLLLGWIDGWMDGKYGVYGIDNLTFLALPYLALPWRRDKKVTMSLK